MTFNFAMRDALRKLYGRAPDAAQTKAAASTAAQEENEMSRQILPHTETYVLVKALAARATLSALTASCGCVTIAPGVGKRILDDTNWPGQRPIKPIRLQERIQWLEQGTWDPRRCVLSFGELPDGRLLLVDGQTRLSAGVHLQRNIGARIEIYMETDMDAVGRLYATFDLHDGSRTVREQLAGEQIPEHMRLSGDMTASVLRAMPIILNGMEPQVRGADATVRGDTAVKAELSRWVKESQAYASLIAGADTFLRRKLRSAGVCAVGLYTMRHAPARAAQFWGGLAANNGLRHDDPRARLIADFSSRVANAGSQRQNVQRAAVAWNAFCQGRDLRIIKCIEGAPIRIASTPLEA